MKIDKLTKEFLATVIWANPHGGESMEECRKMVDGFLEAAKEQGAKFDYVD